MKAYLETNNGMWFDDYVYTAVEPLKRMGITIIKAEELDGYNFHKFKPLPDDIFIGSVEGTIAFWKDLGIEPPVYLGYPNALEEYLDRTIRKTTFGELTLNDLPVFIKPSNDVKLFTGFVLDKKSTFKDINLYYSEINNDTPIYASEIVNIESEYRVFVHKNEIVGIKHYSGDFTMFPNIFDISEMVNAYKKYAPVSYTLDVGIISNIPNDKTILIEVNDFWAIGGYGLDGKIYTRMLIDRFQQIKNSFIQK